MSSTQLSKYATSATALEALIEKHDARPRSLQTTGWYAATFVTYQLGKVCAIKSMDAFTGPQNHQSSPLPFAYIAGAALAVISAGTFSLSALLFLNGTGSLQEGILETIRGKRPAAAPLYVNRNKFTQHPTFFESLFGDVVYAVDHLNYEAKWNDKRLAFTNGIYVSDVDTSGDTYIMQLRTDSGQVYEATTTQDTSDYRDKHVWLVTRKPYAKLEVMGLGNAILADDTYKKQKKKRSEKPNFAHLAWRPN